MNETKSYKIRNPSGEYSSGGNPPKFTKRGKAWSTLGHLKSHLTMLSEYQRRAYEGCTLVELQEVEVREHRLQDLIEDADLRGQDRAQRRIDAAERLRALREEQRRLRSKYGYAG